MTGALICFPALNLGCRLAPSFSGCVSHFLFAAFSSAHNGDFMSWADARGRMAEEKCQHANRARGAVELDFSRLETTDHSVYSVEVSVLVCEECGLVELYAESHRALCDWLGTKR
jgi:hypothetical protein